MNNIKNTFYEKKDYDTYDYYHKYMRIDDIIEDVVYVTHFTENWVKGANRTVLLDDICDEWKEIPKNLQTLCVDDVVVSDRWYRKVLGVVNQNCYVMGAECGKITDYNINSCSSTFSVKELEDLGYKPYIEDIEVPEVEELTSREKKDIKSITDYALKMIIDRVEEIKEIRNKLLEIQKKENIKIKK